MRYFGSILSIFTCPDNRLFEKKNVLRTLCKITTTTERTTAKAVSTIITIARKINIGSNNKTITTATMMTIIMTMAMMMI